MITKLNSLANLIDELELSVKKDSLFHKSIIPYLEKKSSDTFEIEGLSEEKVDEIINFLNDIKRKNFQIKILDIGKNASTQIELNEAKSQGVETLIEVPAEIKNKVNTYLQKIISEQKFLKEVKTKSHETIVEEYNLLPKNNTGIKLGLSSIIIFLSAIVIFLGYIAYFEEKILTRDFGYWSMLGGSITIIVMIYLFLMWIFQYLSFQKKKKEIIKDLSLKLISSLEKKYLELETKLKTKIFDIEKKVFSEACKVSKNSIIEEKKIILKNLDKHFF